MKRKIIPIVAAMLLLSCMLVTGCGAKPEEKIESRPTDKTAETDAEKEEIPETTKSAKYDDIDDVLGFYGGNSENCAKISAADDGSISTVIHTTESVENDERIISEWTLSGDFDPVNGVLTYKDAVKTEKTVEVIGYDQGTIISEVTNPTPSGEIVFSGEGDQISFTWNEMAFNKEIAEPLTPEDLVGRWVKAGGYEIILDIKDDGKLDSYINDPHSGEGPIYWKEGSWSIEGREVCIIIGENEHNLYGNAENLVERDNLYYSLSLTPMTKDVDLP